ncbi:WGR domain protein [Leptospira weilii serovar Ranarum str. ICFT]|uniref:WGR domain protein n=1 Tax=Leptospira weilii serovar Ranarum str. ICFT TaxID=1218598 RepID=N1WCE6_9LEPT|nr:WGR domain-containing protein [Leptospira weilii]EMY77941.1 WGR domain protein [Leptospira weilii serovar Ranarum str. ICFT]
MKHRLTYKDDKSDKFWNIEVSGNSFTVTYGKIGTAGQTQTKTFGSEEECAKEANELLSEKLKKGYVEGDATLANTKSNTTNTEKKNNELKADYLKEWQAIVDAKDLHKALIEHFSYLVDNPKYDRLLEAIMQKVQSAAVEENSLQILFPNDFVLNASAPSSIEESGTWPESFKKLIEVHELIEFGDSKNRHIDRDLVLGDHGSFSDEFIDDEEFENAESPLIDDQSDWWIYHPEEKNEQNQPMLYYVSHESAGVKENFPHNVGSLFLKRLADRLKIDKSFYPKSEDNRSTELELLKDVTLPFYIMKAESIGENKIAAILSRDDQRVFGILDTFNLEDVKLIGKTEFPSSRDGFNMKVSGSKAILFNQMTSLLNPLVWIDISDLASPKVGGVIDEKGTEAAAIYQDQVVYKTSQLFHLNLLTGEKKTFKSLIRAKELLIDEDVIVVQNQDEIQVLDLQFNLISQGKVNSGFPKTILFPELKWIVSLDDSLQVLSYAGKKIQKQKLPSLKGHSFRRPYFISGNSIWFLTTADIEEEVKYNLVRLDLEREEIQFTVFRIPNDLEYDERAIEIVSDEIRIYLRNKTLVYRLENV